MTLEQAEWFLESIAFCDPALHTDYVALGVIEAVRVCMDRARTSLRAMVRTVACIATRLEAPRTTIAT